MNKKAMCLAFVFLLLLIPIASAELLRDVQGDAWPGGVIEVTFIVKEAVIGEKVVLSEIMPVGATLVDWSVIGAVEQNSEVLFTQSDQTITWEFTANVNAPVISYKARLGDEESLYFDAVYALPPDRFGFSRKSMDTVEPGETARLETPGSSFSIPFWIWIVITIIVLGSAGAYFVVRIKHLQMLQAKDLHTLTRETLMLSNKNLMMIRYKEILGKYSELQEAEKGQYYSEVQHLYEVIANMN